MTQPPTGDAPYSSGPPPQAGGTTTAPKQSTTRATTALILSIIPTVITTVVGLVLAILVVSNRSDPRNGGRGRAIAAIVIAALWIVVGVIFLIAVVFVAANIGPDRNSDGEITSTGQVSTDDLKVGDCLTKAVAEQTYELIDVGPCTSRHRGEVVAQFELEDGDFPGEEQVQKLADEGCTSRATEELGDNPPNAESLSIFYLYPQEDTWDQTHRVDCIVESSKATTEKLQRQG